MPRIIDSSRYTTAVSECMRKRYWAYEYDGKGLTPNTSSFDLLFGAGMASATECLKLHQPFDVALEALETHVSQIQGETPDGLPEREEGYALGYGLLWTYQRHFLPIFEETYEITATELEIINEIAPDFYWATRLDGLCKRRDDGMGFVIEDKTSGWIKSLGSSKEFSIQLLMEAESTRRHLAVDYLGGVLLTGFSKGEKRDVSKGERDKGMFGKRRRSPFTYAYRKLAKDGSQRFDLEYTKGWDLTPTWKEPGLEEWLAYLEAEHREKMKEQVVLIDPPFKYAPERVKSAIRQVHNVEIVIAQGADLALHYPERRQEMLDQFFPQNTERCNNDGKYGQKCPFQLLCWENVNNPKDYFSYRKPNHPIEKTIWEGTK